MQAKHFYEFGRFCLDPDDRRLLRENEVVSLTPKAFEILVVLVQKAGHLVEKEELMKKVWGDTFVEDKTLTQTIYTLRGVLGDNSTEQRYIENVPKRGYRFVADVREGWNEKGETNFENNTEIALEQKTPQISSNTEKSKQWFSRTPILTSGVALFCITIGIVVVRQTTETPKRLQVVPAEGRVEIRSPTDEAEVRRVVKESQFYETLTLYVNPKDFNKDQLNKYWLPSEQGGKEIKEVESAVQRLLSKGMHYGKESKAERYEFRYVRIFSPRDYAEVGTIERWYVPAYREDGSRVLGRNEYLGPYPVDFTLRKINGAWLIEEASNPRPANR